MNSRFQPMWGRSDLIAALDAHEIVPFFQPKVELATGRPVSVEILARWMHPRLGLLTPDEFVPAMEKHDLVGQLALCLLEQSLRMDTTGSLHPQKLGYAINLSPMALQQSGIAGRIHALANRYQVVPSRVTVEITETAGCDAVAKVLESVTYLRKAGFNISADDFGIGYSSLQELNRLPFTEIKIDRVFVAGITNNPKSEAILESIVALANKLEMQTVAEGIETTQEMHFMKMLGCQIGQGFFFAKPLNQEELRRYVDATYAKECVRYTPAYRKKRSIPSWLRKTNLRCGPLAYLAPTTH